MFYDDTEMGGLISLVVDLAFVFGPVVGYIPQYNSIKRARSAGNFALL